MSYAAVTGDQPPSESSEAIASVAVKNSSDPDALVNGPIEGVKYPIKVVYCGECSLPLEYCCLYRDFNKCKEWLEKTLPDLFEEMYVNDESTENKDGEGEADGEKKRQKRGGKALVKSKTKKAIDRKIGLARASRGKKKFVTVVTGLSTFEVDLKDATKFFASKFACGSSVTGPDEIVIQGDVKDDLFDIICEKWPDIDEDLIDDLGDRKL